jgi:Domain of unknown function (DUF4440)/Activator of Hsp90 ATPase homolog 1-like protein
VTDGVATAIVEVAVDPPTAFEVFTEEVAAWWRAARLGEGESVRFEPGVGGRVLALAGEPDMPPVEVGRVLVWEPGPRLAFTYRDNTEVEVRFEAAEHGTRVVLEHRGFDHGLTTDLSDDWAGLLDRFADRSRERVLLGRLAEFVTAIAENDVEFFRENMTDDAVCVFPGVDGVYDREQTAAGMADHPPYVKYLLDDPRVIDAGPTAAVLMARGVIQRIDDATPRSWVVSNTFVNRDGNWKLAFVQWTPG